MFGEKLIIKKYPYLGYSPNLIEYFGIIGYSENFIPELISSIKNANLNPQSQTKIISSYPPTVLSSITSKNDYGIVDNELIITQLYPDNPEIIIWEQNIPEPKKSNVIYSFCFDSMDGQMKLFYTCFGYKFYELFKEGEDKYYIPKAFCVISQYPFFNAFFNICNDLYDILINKKNIIPFEILLYNIINYIPSPINNKLKLYLFGSEYNDAPKIELNQLTGYPNLDFDLYEIFNLLPLNIILEIYVFTFLEQSILFFSSNLELLNTIMYIMYMFNYPCNDSTYFWHIVSVGKNNLVEENKFVGKIMLSLLGVNCTYESSIDTSAFGNYHIVVDIDNKKMIFKESLNISLDEKEDAVKLDNLFYYIENIFKEKNVNSNIIKKPLLKLKSRIENYLYEKLPGYSTNPKKNFVNFFKTDKNPKNSNINNKLLEFFYDCNLTLLTNFYNDNQLNSSFDKIEKKENNGSENLLNKEKFTEAEEKYFFELFRNSVKYKIYFDNFLAEFEVMDVFKIPFLFSRIFLELKIRDQEEISCENIEYFQLIDKLYGADNSQTIIKKINFDSFNKQYKENISQYFKRFFVNDYDNNIFGKNAIEETGQTDIPKEKKLQLINMNKKIINRYIYILQNFYEREDIDNIFPQIKRKENKVIKIQDRRAIYRLIKDKLIEKKFISSLDYLIYSISYVVSLTIILHPFEQMVSNLAEIQESFKLIKYFTPHYIYTLVKSIYKYYLINKTTTLKYPTMILSHIKMYFYFLANFIRSQFIVPDEEMMFILNCFFSDIIFQERNEINTLDEQKKSKINDELNNNNITPEIKKEFEDVYKNKSYLIFMKYCFNGKKIYKSKTMVEKAMLEYESSTVFLNVGNKKNNPQIVIKINDYVFKSKFYTPKKLFKDSENIFEDLFDNYNLDSSYMDVNKLREIILNLIQYGIELQEKKLPIGYLMNTLYLLRNAEEKNQNYKEEKNE